MKTKLFSVMLFAFLAVSCVKIPQETITLSQTLGKDLAALQTAHQHMIQVHFTNIKEGINAFVDETYAPFVIHYVLKKELANERAGKESLYRTIRLAGETPDQVMTQKAVDEMYDFQKSARKQIEKKRKELLEPIEQQEAEILLAVSQSYKNALYANATVTGYLESVKKVKDAQQNALSLLGLEKVEAQLTDQMLKLSDQVKKAVLLGKEVDIKSEDAYQKLEDVSKKIKNSTNKVKEDVEI